jgi:hypothetical protein
MFPQDMHYSFSIRISASGQAWKHPSIRVRKLMQTYDRFRIQISASGQAWKHPSFRIHDASHLTESRYHP